MAKKKNFIQNAIGKPGALHHALGIPEGQKIPKALLEKAAKKPGKVGEEARLAEVLAGFHKKRKKKST